MNFRKPFIKFLLYASGSRIPHILKEIKEYEYASVDIIKKIQERKLKQLLLHAYTNVPYYHKILPDYKVVINENVNLANFHNLPVLTKSIIRDQGEDLYSKDYKSRKFYTNTSGGSTGEPVRFIQDQEYEAWNTANKIYFNTMLGKELGEREIKFWGSDRDIIKGNLTYRDRLINRLYNRKFFNSYTINEDTLKDLIELNNHFKPKMYWAYMESALELSRFLLKSKISFHPPKLVISTIGPLTEDVKEAIEKGMNTKVYNQYGSREVGALACQCKEQKGLHVFPWSHYVEILDKNHVPVQNQEGDVAVTTLCNYSMPLIRYQIGDIAIGEDLKCDCGRNTFVLHKILGRTLGYFKKSDGTLVHSHFIVQALFNHNWIKMFQIVQKAYNSILIKIEKTTNCNPLGHELHDIEHKIKLLMGPNCMVTFQYVDTIEKTPSGKYLYTICDIK